MGVIDVSYIKAITVWERLIGSRKPSEKAVWETTTNAIWRASAEKPNGPNNVLAALETSRITSI